MRRGLVLLLVAGLLAPAALAAAYALRSEPARTVAPSLEVLAAKNYRTLTKSESRTLVRYAAAVHRCVAAEARGIAPPVASATRILMRAPNRSAHELVELLTTCNGPVGPPPAKASLQARDGLILVYVPEQCLLDPTERSDA
jgi:hypothetical protein